jgi:drug/metabolite transporter (DMT)-like permease
MPGEGGRPLAAAVAGTAIISGSAVVMQLANASASLTALARCGFALPVLGVLVLRERRRGAAPLGSRSRWLARLSGVFLAGDLIVWSHAINAIGAGLGTVVPNLQVLFISVLGWLILGERPHRSLLFAAPVMAAGLVLVGGLADTHAYGADPAAGVAEGVAVAALYSVYIFMLRQATTTKAGPTKPAPVSTLFEATLAATVTSAVLGLVLDDFRLAHPWAAHLWSTLGWLLVLAMTSQVVGWLLITKSLPGLPAWMIGVVLLIQPAGSVTLGYLVLAERPSMIQLAGVALMLTGVLIAVIRGAAQHEDHAPGTGVLDRDVDVEVAVAGQHGEPAG